jgi:ATP/maltotriose-dependent transcriptional regulator MalT
MPLESALTEAWLKKGDLARARAHADVLSNVTLASGDPTWHALAWEANARVASADGNLPGALECIAKAVTAVEKADIPLAAWQVHATAAELYGSAGNARFAERAHELSQTTILKLANSLEGPLRQSFLAGVSAGRKATSGL